MSGRSARVFTIPHGVDFPDTLAEALLSGRILSHWPDLKNPLTLSVGTLYVPTRRAARALSERLAARVPSDAILLPRIVPLGGLDEAEDRMIIERGLDAFDRIGLEPEIEPARRRLVLARLIMAWSQAIESNLSKGEAHRHFSQRLAAGMLEDKLGFAVISSPRDSLMLADALGQLIDTLVIHNKTWNDIHDLVPQDLADDYWKITRDFLEIAAREWPHYCAEHGVKDAAERRHHLLLAEADRLINEAPDAPIIAAGSTGTMPSTAALIAAIAHLPNGAVILPGLDMDLDQPSFDALIDDAGRLVEPQHPQSQLRRLIHIIGIKREDVVSLGVPAPSLAKRMTFLSEAMRPTSTTDLWQERAARLSDADMQEALQSVSVVEAAHEREEATAIAIALREALETPDRTAALITPDRTLAERVQSELRRWNIEVEDSAGTSLARTEAGSLALLLAEAVADDFAPWSLVALLAHPRAVFGLDTLTRDRANHAINIGLLRKPNYPRGLDALLAHCESSRSTKIDHRKPKPEQRLTSTDWQAAITLMTKLKLIRGVFPSSAECDLVALTKNYDQTLRHIAAHEHDADMWDRLSGAKEFADLIQSIAPNADISLNGSYGDFPGFLDGLMRGVMVRDHRKAHPRIRIFGLLEARLLPVDLAVLAGLDEGVWPPDMRTDPFLNRPWRESLLLPAPERRVGQTAHDLMGAMGARDVILTRAAKRSGAPTVASRFLQRMEAVAGEALFRQAKERGNLYLDLARDIDQFVPTGFIRKIMQPQPVVTRDHLPAQLSVTKIETLRRDPYSIYAQYVLGLDPLDMIAPPIGSSEIGTAFHDALAKFGDAYPHDLPENAREKLLEFGQASFADLSDQPEFSAFWWPRFERAADWFLHWDRNRRALMTGPAYLEQRGQLTFELPHGGQFTLTARADRIELHTDKSYTVIDYKTGSPPSPEQVRIGLNPQLTLEAAMIERGAFLSIDATAVRDLLYVKLGSRVGGEEKSAIKDGLNAADLVSGHFHSLTELIDAHWNQGRPFASRPIAEFASRYAEYDHLARVKEWSISGDADEGGGA